MDSISTYKSTPNLIERMQITLFFLQFAVLFKTVQPFSFVIQKATGYMALCLDRPQARKLRPVAWLNSRRRVRRDVILHAVRYPFYEDLPLLDATSSFIAFPILPRSSIARLESFSSMRVGFLWPRLGCIRRSQIGRRNCA